MKHLKTLGLAALAATALTAVAAGSASATTLEVGGVTKNSSAEIVGGIAPSTAGILSLTGGSFVGECEKGSGSGSSTSPFTGTTVGGPASSASASGCARTVTVHKPGSVSVQHISGSTNGTVRSANSEVTVGSPIGTLNCTTGSGGVHMGVITGTSEGQATVHINAVINCGFLAPSAVVTGTAVGGSAEGSGVSA